MKTTVAAQPTTDVWVRLTKPAYPGQLRTRTWRLPWIPPQGERDPVWAKRAKDYWMRQERKYGLVMSDFTLMMDDVPGIGPVVTTAATVVMVLAGRRVPVNELPPERYMQVH